MCGIYLEEGRRFHCSQADARDEISGAKVRTGSCSSVEKRRCGLHAMARRPRRGPRPSDEPPSGLDLLPREMTETRGRKKTSEESIRTMTDLHFLVKQRRKKQDIPTRGGCGAADFLPTGRSSVPTRSGTSGMEHSRQTPRKRSLLLTLEAGGGAACKFLSAFSSHVGTSFQGVLA